MTVHTDGEGRVGAVRDDAQLLSACRDRAHIWSHVLTSHEDTTAATVMSRANCRDVEEERTAACLRLGNNLLDRFAKLGTKAHMRRCMLDAKLLVSNRLPFRRQRGLAKAHAFHVIVITTTRARHSGGAKPKFDSFGGAEAPGDGSADDCVAVAC